jgi:hypothetical protein
LKNITPISIANPIFAGEISRFREKENDMKLGSPKEILEEKITLLFQLW